MAQAPSVTRPAEFEDLGAAIAPAKPSQPVNWLAACGLMFVLFSIYLFGSWIIDGPTRTPPGASTLPTWMRWSLDIQMWLSPAIAVGFIYYFLVRPWRREGHLTVDGFMIIAILTTYWQDILCNYFAPYTMYNSRLPNWGAWYDKIPGWMSPHGERVAEPILWPLSIYVVGFFGSAVLGCHIMRRSERRWPGISRIRLFWTTFFALSMLFLVLEVIWIRSGIYIYQGVFTPGWLTLFDGKYYQVPLNEPFLIGFCLAIFSALRYFKNDRGETFAERGIDQFRGSARQRNRRRLFAFIGFINLMMLIWNGVSMLGSLHLRAWPEDVYSKSYFTNMVCGPGTDYACPNGTTPFNNANFPVRFAPDGTVVIPEGTKIPIQTGR